MRRPWRHRLTDEERAEQAKIEALVEARKCIACLHAERASLHSYVENRQENPDYAVHTCFSATL